MNSVIKALSESYAIRRLLLPEKNKEEV